MFGYGTFAQLTFAQGPDEGSPPPADVSVASFSPSFGYPIRRTVCAALLAPALAWGVYTPPAQADTGWLAPFSEPTVRSKVRVADALFSSPVDPNPRISIGWYAPFHELTPKRIFTPSCQQFLAQDLKPIVSFGWYGWLSDPPKPKNGLHASRQQAFATDTDVNIDPGNSPWFAPLSEPVRVRKRLQAGLNPFETADVDPVVPFSWFGNLSSPVLVKARLQPSLNPFIVTDDKPFITFGWFGNLSEPVRQKIGLRAPHHQTLAFDPNPLVNTGVMGWYDWLSEPVRQKVGLRSSYQVSYTSPERVLPNPVFVTMLAVETPNDIFTSGLSVVDIANTARVSIEEVEAGNNSPVSLREP